MKKLVGQGIKETKLFSWEEDIVKNFYQEVIMMDKMRSSYFINFVGAVETPQHYSIVTEYAKCGNAVNYYKGNNYSKVMTVKILLDVANGMKILHSNHLIHRDIKSENILIASFSRDEQVNAKISDFGTSRTTTALTATMTQKVGTPIYNAPELLMKKKYGIEVDIFSFAIVCYEIFTRKVPYENFKHLWDITDFVVEGKRLDIPNEIDDEMKTIISDCWKQNPLERPKFDVILKRLEKYYQPIDDEERRNKISHSVGNSIIDNQRIENNNNKKNNYKRKLNDMYVEMDDE